MCAVVLLRHIAVVSFFFVIDMMIYFSGHKHLLWPSFSIIFLHRHAYYISIMSKNLLILQITTSLCIEAEHNNNNKNSSEKEASRYRSTRMDTAFDLCNFAYQSRSTL